MSKDTEARGNMEPGRESTMKASCQCSEANRLDHRAPRSRPRFPRPLFVETFDYWCQMNSWRRGFSIEVKGAFVVHFFICNSNQQQMKSPPSVASMPYCHCYEDHLLAQVSYTHPIRVPLVPSSHLISAGPGWPYDELGTRRARP